MSDFCFLITVVYEIWYNLGFSLYFQLNFLLSFWLVWELYWFCGFGGFCEYSLHGSSNAVAVSVCLFYWRVFLFIQNLFPGVNVHSNDGLVLQQKCSF